MARGAERFDAWRAAAAWALMAACLSRSALAGDIAATPAAQATRAHVLRQWTVEDGLPSNAITALAEDEDGLIWIATLAGLVRFDGLNFDVHDAARHRVLSSDRFTTMKRTPDGALWLSSEQYDLFRFADETFVRIEGASVLCVAQSPSGWLAYGTTRGILVADAAGTRWIEGEVADQRVIELDWPADERLLALTDTQLLEIGRPLARTAHPQRSRPSPGLNSGALLALDDGSVLIGRSAGLERIGTDWAAPPQVLIADEAVVALHSLDRRQVMVGTGKRIGMLEAGRLRWIGGNQDSLSEAPMQVRIGEETWQVLADRIDDGTHVRLQAPSRIADVRVDHERNLWVATNASGLLQYRASDMRLLGTPEGLGGNNVYPILAARDGTMWLASIDGGLQHLSGAAPAQWTRIAVPFGVAWSLLELRDGSLLVGGEGACVLREGVCSRAGLPASLQQQTPIRASHEDPRGRLWIGSIWGLWRRDGAHWRMLPESEGTRPGRAARAFVDDGADRLWIATNGDGVLELRNGRRVRQIGTAEGLSSGVVRALFRAPDALWAGTENRGLCRIRVDAAPLQVRCLGRAEGLPSSGLHAIMADAAGRFWINSNQGVYTVERAELDAVLDRGGVLERTRLYNARSGLRSSEGNGAVWPAAARDGNGELWFPTQAGVAIFDPASSSAPALPVTVRVDRAQFGSTVLRAPVRIDLGAAERALSLQFTANSYQDPEHVRLRYRFAGESWADLGNRRELQLGHLAPGDWRLELQARNAGADWPALGTVLALVVAPAWHERGLVRGLIVLLGMALVAAAFMLRGAQLRRRQHALEAIVAERTRDLEEAKRGTEAALDIVSEQHAELGRLHRSRTEFAANISHELKTPLTLLTAPLADHPDIAGVVGAELFEAMRDSGQRMQRLLRQLADLHLIDSAALPLKVDSIALNDFVARCVLPFAALAGQRHQLLSTRWDADPHAAITIDVFQFEKVIGNLLSNAIKFTPVPGQIRISTAADANEATILVEDSGAGVAEAHRRAIFERFYQVDGSFRRAHEGSGIGLALAREIVELHGGSLHYASSALGGAGFRVTLPMAQPVALPRDAPAPAIDAITASSSRTTHSEETSPAVDAPDRPRILLVEDQATLRTYLRSAFAGRYEVLEAGNGREGLQMAVRQLPDVIISDVMMPLMDGVQMARALRADAATRCIPLVFLTAVDGEHAQIAGLVAGGDHYFTKPFSAQVLRAHVDALLRRRGDLLLALTPAPLQPAVEALVSAPTLLSRAETIIRARLDDTDFDLDALVRALATSRSQLHRRLQAEHGLSPGELITRTRLDAAAELLAAGRGRVTEVCYSVGFLSLGSFSRAFKARHGCNPGEYAERVAPR